MPSSTTPRDKLIWDVGHQCYPHKVLDGAAATGSAPCARKAGCRASPSATKAPHDPFRCGPFQHLDQPPRWGFAVGRDMGQPTGDSIAVIGDGSISAGMA